MVGAFNLLSVQDMRLEVIRDANVSVLSTTGFDPVVFSPRKLPMWPRVIQDGDTVAGVDDTTTFDRSRSRVLNPPPSSQPRPCPLSKLLAADFPSEVRAIQAWFGRLNGTERAAAFSAVAQLATPHEAQFLRLARPQQKSANEKTDSDDRAPYLVPIGTPPDRRGVLNCAPRGGTLWSCGGEGGSRRLSACSGQDGSICCKSGETDWLCSWLRSLRLHKYTHSFQDLTLDELLALNDEGLQRRGVNTFGARKKLMSVSALSHLLPRAETAAGIRC